MKVTDKYTRTDAALCSRNVNTKGKGRMGKYFGTDGFRGEANENLTADHASFPWLVLWRTETQKRG